MTGTVAVEGTERSPLPKWLGRRALAWAAALLASLVVALTAGFLLHERQALEASEVQSAELYARVLQDHAERTFNTIDIAMGALADTLDTEALSKPTSHVNEDLTRALTGLPFLRSLSVVTRGGQVVASSSAANRGVVIDLDAVVLPADGTTDALGSSVNGRDLADATAGRQVAGSGTLSAPRTFVPLTRSVGNASGPRLYLVAVINPDYFANAHELTLADETRSAGLFSMSGVMLAGTGKIQKSPGDSIGRHRFFTDFLPARESGSFFGAGMAGEKVVTAFRVLRKRPVAVVVERPSASILSGFRQTLVTVLAACAGALLFIAATLAVGWRSLRSHEAVSADLERTRRGVEASEHDLRVLVESVHELIFRADATGRIVFVNGRWQELTGRPAADAMGKRVTDLCREDERPACFGLFAQADRHQETILVHIQDAAGQSLTLDLSLTRMLKPDGRVAGFAGFAADVSARVAAQQALQSQLTFNMQLLEVSPTPLFVKDVAGRFVNVNRAWLALMNLTLPEVLGRESSELFGGDAAKHQDHDARLLQTEGRVSYDNQLLVAGRPARDTVVTKVRFNRADGTAAGIVGSIVDVTEFRAAERTIRKAKDAAESANQAKSEFIANITHELRTPLQAIIGYSDIGRDLAGDLAAVRPDLLDLFTDIHAGGQRMLTLVNGLLDVSQMDSAVGSLPLQRVNLSEIVRDAVMQVQAQSVVRNLKLELEGLDEAPEGDVDRVRFQQAVRIVLSNAVRYSPVGGRIDVSLTDAGLSGIKLTVRDHGPGIPEAELEQVFEAFVQSSRTRDGSGGAGLGLTIARKIMGAHGGSIVAANGQGGGALITLALPATGPVSPTRTGLQSRDPKALLSASEVH